MLEVLELPASALVIGLVLLVPGAAALALTGVSRAVGAYLLLPTSLFATLGISTAVFGVMLAHGSSMASMRAVWLFVAAVLGLAWIAKGFRDHRTPARLGRAMGGVVVSWVRQIGPWLLSVCVLTAVASFAVGAMFRGDTLYHLAQALKILELDVATLDNTTRLVEGDANPAYFIPVSQAMLALCASLTGLHVGAVAELMGMTLVPAAILAYAGLAGILARSRACATVAGSAYAGLAVFVTTPVFLPIRGSYFPGNMVIDILLPSVPALAFLATFGQLTRGDARRIHGVLALCSLLVVVLHANYVLYLGLVVLAFVLGSLIALRSAFPLKAAIATSLSSVGVAAVGLAALLPVLTRLSHFGDSPVESDGVGLFERFAPLLDGNAESFHMIPGQLYIYGGILIVGTVAAGLLPLWKPREPAAWYASTMVLLLTLITQWDWLYMQSLGTGSISVMLRIGRIMPAILGIACLAVWAWNAVHRRGRGRWVLGALCIVVGTAVLVATVLYPYGLRSFAASEAKRMYPGWPLYLSAAAALAGMLRAGRGTRGAMSTAAARQPSGAAAALLSGAILIGLVVPATEAAREIGPLMAERASGGRFEVVEGVDADAVDELERVRVGGVVLAPPRPSYAIPAQVPVYVVGDFKYWLGDTSESSPGERLAVVEKFFANATSDDERRAIICEWRPDAIYAGRGTQAALAYIRDDAQLVGRFRKTQGGGGIRLLEWSGVPREERTCDGPPYGGVESD